MTGAVQVGIVRSESLEEFRRWVEGIPPPSPGQKADEAGPDSGHTADVVAGVAGDSSTDDDDRS